LHVTDSGYRPMHDRDVIFCVLIACHSKESRPIRIRNIYTAVRYYYYCILR